MKLLKTMALFVALTNSSVAYDMATHYQLSDAAVKQSNLNEQDMWVRLGIEEFARNAMMRTSIGSNHAKFSDPNPPCRHDQVESPSRLISCGSVFEDAPGIRSLNHFFDAQHGGRGLTVLLPLGYSSSVWALDNADRLDQQDFSYRQGQKYFLQSLIEDSIQGRSVAASRMLQTLGQVIHHIQDMAQPQHVRNDPHLDVFSDDRHILINHPSRFEAYANFLGASLVISEANQGSIPPIYPHHRTEIKTPQQFWSNNDLGIADYTSSNFVSAGKNFVFLNGQALPHPEYPLPRPGPATSLHVTDPMLFGASPPAAIDSLCNDRVSLPAEYLANCRMTFYSSEVFDALEPDASSINPRASTASLFDEDLRQHATMTSIDMGTTTVTTMRVFSLNRFNFDAALQYLVPKAVAYSAGLINYFFRGRLEISTPEAGVYAVVDHHVEGCKDVCGFRKIKARVRNATPGESMTAGSFKAIAKYHRNTCYRPDLSGDPAGSAFAGLACRSEEEEIVVSAEGRAGSSRLAALAEDEEREVIFEFPRAIPINASDVVLQVMFQGTLGEEANAVAVGTRDIAEPNYLALGNSTDYVFDDLAGGQYHLVPYGDFARPWPLNGIAISFGGPSPVAMLSQLSGGQHGQIAFLPDRGTVGYSIRLPSETAGTLAASEFRLVPSGSQYMRTVGFVPSRHMYRQHVLTLVYRASEASPSGFSCNESEGGVCDQSSLRPFTPDNASDWVIEF